jgi:hypothetical protein
MGICDWYSRILKRSYGYKPHKAQIKAIEEAIIFAKAEFYEKYKAECRGEGWIPNTPTPETVESVLNKFIDAGHDKPEVVITGKKMLDGREHWTASIDGAVVLKPRTGDWNFSQIYKTLADAEIGVVDTLKRKLNSIITHETTVTF